MDVSTIHGRGEVLGWGSFAKVFHSWDELLDRPVAVKELVQPFAGSEAFVRGYFAQALRMIDVAHPNLLAIYSVEPNRFPPALTREMAEQPLAHRLFDGPLAPEEVARALRHALAGLAALHARDLVHLSVRPENLLVCGEVYKLGDFGVVPMEGAPPIPPRQLRYSAPEMLGGEPRPAAAADLYSLGLVAWELLLGSERLERVLETTLAGSASGARDRPEGDRLWLAFHRSEVELPPIHELEPAVPVALSLVLERMVRKDPGARPASAREALTALSPPPSETGGAAAPGPEKAPPATARRGGPTWLALGVAAALVLAGVALWFGLRNRQSSGPEWPADAGSPDAVTEVLRTAGDASTKERAPIDPGPVSVPSLAAALRRLAGEHPGLRFDLEPPRGESRTRLPIGSALRFRVDSDRRVFVSLFALSSTGTLTCLYPRPGGRPPEAIPGRTLILPLPEDERAGFELVTTPPAGTDHVFLLASDRPLPALPPGRASGWVTDFPVDSGAGENPAAGFVRWVGRLLAENPDGNRLSLLQIEVVTAV
jgi:serine/threonine-protein kinase